MPSLQEALNFVVEKMQSGELAEAQSVIDQVLEQFPDHPSALMVSGSFYAQSGNLEKAFAQFDRCNELQPDDPIPYFARADLEQTIGKTDEAIAHYRRCLELSPKFVPAIANLAELLRRTGQLSASESLLRSGIDQVGFEPILFHNLGALLTLRGEREEAIALFSKMLEIDRANHAAALGLARVLRDDGQLTAAAGILKSILEANVPEAAQALPLLGKVLLEIGLHEEAENVLRIAAENKLELEDTQINLGRTLIEMGRLEEAAEILREVHASNPSKPETNHLLGILASGQNDPVTAMESFRKTLAGDPAFAEAYYMMSQVNPKELLPNEIARMRLLADDARLPAIDRTLLLFGLGKIEEKSGKPARSFEYFRQGNQLRHQVAQQNGNVFHRNRHRELANRLIEIFTPKFFEPWQGSIQENLAELSERAVFIVGMPRSGTSLVEQILDSHPQAFGAGERSAMSELIAVLPMVANPPRPYPDCLLEMSPQAGNGLAEKYLAELTALAPQKVRIIDKMPANLLHLGLISMLFPRARIIRCERDPLDTCLSCFQQYFATTTLPMTLEDWGHCYLDYERVFAHYAKVITNPIEVIRYEDLVCNLATKGRELVEFCGLPWDEACLDYHLNPRRVRTASNIQVRQPVYTSSVGRWEQYKHELEPLRAVIEAGRS